MRTINAWKILDWLNEYPSDAKIRVRTIKSVIKEFSDKEGLPATETIPVDFIIEWNCREETKREMIAMIREWRKRK